VRRIRITDLLVTRRFYLGSSSPRRAALGPTCGRHDDDVGAGAAAGRARYDGDVVHRLFVFVGAAVACAVAVATLPAQSPPPAPLTLLSVQGRRPLPVAIVNGTDYLSLDELAAALGLTLRDDRVTGATTVSLRARSAVLTPDRTVVSVQGRLVSLAAPPLRQDGRLLVTPEFVTRVLAVVVDQRVEFRRPGRLLVLGELRVPRVVTRGEFGANAAQITFEVSPATEATVTAASGQILVTFAADAVDAAVPTVPAQGLVQAIRTGDGTPTVTLVTGPRFASHRTSTPAIDAGTSRLVIDVMAAGAESLSAAAPAPAPVPAPGTPAGAPAPSGSDPSPPLSFDPTAVGVRTVVLDPGHGGDADGTEGPGGTLEKTVTLQVSRKVKALIESRLGLRVVMTRDDDRALDQDERAAIANNNRADLFVSIHANAAVRATVKGAEVYYLSVDRADLEARRRLQNPGQALPQLGGGTRAIELILWETAQVRHLEQSAGLAALVESALRSRVEMSPRPVQQAPFRVLVGANMPAVLVEVGYLSHPGEEKALASSAHQDRLALAIFEAISTFRERLEKPAQ
jgi:N-acetylmuramoyl-L-alanine amidase